VRTRLGLHVEQGVFGQTSSIELNMDTQCLRAFIFSLQIRAPRSFSDAIVSINSPCCFNFAFAFSARRFGSF
jgi:hypothetical protein